MTQAQLTDLIEKPADLLSTLKSERPNVDISKLLAQYEPEKHAIMDPAQVPDKPIKTDRGDSTAPINRIAIPLQKKIVQYAAAFLCGNKIQLDASAKNEQKKLLDVIQKTLDDNKMQYKDLQIAEILFSETEVAELWHSETLKNGDDYWAGTANEKKSTVRFRMRILANSLGDKLYPSFNEFNDMNAFGRYYTTGNSDAQKEHLDFYTEDAIRHYEKGTDDWKLVKKTPNPTRKIPIIYYRKNKAEWEDVQPHITRYETSISRHGDTNDYFGSPVILLKGSIEGFAKKGESGKVLTLSKGAEAEYMTWDHSPESVKLEQNNLRSLSFDMSDTPDISFTQMSKLGVESGYAMKMLFLAPHLKAARNEMIFGEGVQRRLNFLKAAMMRANVSLEKARSLVIKPKFKYFLPENATEELDNIVSAAQGGILSIESAVEKSPLTSDKDAEIKRLAAEKKAAETDPRGLDNDNNDDDETGDDEG